MSVLLIETPGIAAGLLFITPMSESRSVTATIGLFGVAASLALITSGVISGAMGASVRDSARTEPATSRVFEGSRTISLTGWRIMNGLPDTLFTVGAGVASVRISRRLPPTGSPWAMTVGSQVTFHPELRCRAVPDVADSYERSLSHRQVVLRLNDAVPSLYSSGLSTLTSIESGFIAVTVCVRASAACPGAVVYSAAAAASFLLNALANSLTAAAAPVSGPPESIRQVTNPPALARTTQATRATHRKQYFIVPFFTLVTRVTGTAGLQSELGLVTISSRPSVFPASAPLDGSAASPLDESALLPGDSALLRPDDSASETFSVAVSRPGDRTPLGFPPSRVTPAALPCVARSVGVGIAPSPGEAGSTRGTRSSRRSEPSVVLSPTSAAARWRPALRDLDDAHNGSWSSRCSGPESGR